MLPLQSFYLWSSYGTLTLIAITICPILVEPAQARKNQSTWDESLEITNSEPEMLLMEEDEIQAGDTRWQLTKVHQPLLGNINQPNGIDSLSSLHLRTKRNIPIEETAHIDQSQGVAFHGTTQPTLAEKRSSENLEITVTQTNQGVLKTILQASNNHQESNYVKHNLLDGMKPLKSTLTTQLSNRLSFESNLPVGSTNQEPTLPNSKSEDQVNQQESFAKAPFEVNFSNPFNEPIGESISPELPPLSSSDEYLPNSEQIAHRYIWPAKGTFTSGYGQRWGRRHEGIDIAAPIGTPIWAAASGKVVFAGWNDGGFGKLVKLRHSDNSFTLYAHNHKILVQPGEHVNQGEVIAKMGNTGRSTGPHLHFEIHPSEKQQAVDPLAYLPDGKKLQEGQKVYKLGKK